MQRCTGVGRCTAQITVQMSLLIKITQHTAINAHAAGKEISTFLLMSFSAAGAQVPGCKDNLSMCSLRAPGSQVSWLSVQLQAQRGRRARCREPGAACWRGSRSSSLVCFLPTELLREGGFSWQAAGEVFGKQQQRSSAAAQATSSSRLGIRDSFCLFLRLEDKLQK